MKVGQLAAFGTVGLEAVADHGPAGGFATVRWRVGPKER